MLESLKPLTMTPLPEGTSVSTKSSGEVHSGSSETVRHLSLIRDLIKDIKTLDDITPNYRLAVALNLPESEHSSSRAYARELVRLGLLSPERPQGHPTHSGSHISAYYLPMVVDTHAAGWAERNIRAAVLETVITLDDIPRNASLGSLLGLSPSDRGNRVHVAQALVRLKLISPEVPDSFTSLSPNGVPIRGRMKTFYIDEAIVGKDQARLNLEKIVSRMYPDLESFKIDGHLAAILGLEEKQRQSVPELVKATVEAGLVAATVPEQFKKTLTRQSRLLYYYQSDVVGEAKARENLKSHFKCVFPTLDDVKFKPAFHALFNVESSTTAITPILKKLVEDGTYSPQMPEHHEIYQGGSKISSYVDPDVVGADYARRNLETYIRSRYPTLDDIPLQGSLSAALGIAETARSRPELLATAIVREGFLSPILPDGHSISRSSYRSRYLNGEVVGESTALDNLKRHLTSTYTNVGEILGDIPNRHVIAAVLGVRDSLPLIRESIIKRGWLSHTSSLPYVTEIPPEFGRQMRDSPNSPLKKAITTRQNDLPHALMKLPHERLGAELYCSYYERARWIKGEAFEQLVGVALALRYPEQAIIPQFCLDVDAQNGYFGCRADFRVGNDIIEVKWGRAEENIIATREKHLAHLQGTEFNYRLIVCRHNNKLNLPTERFSTLVRELPLGDVLMKSAKHIIEGAHTFDTTLLTHYRDFFYSTLRELTILTGSERLEYAETLLGTLNQTTRDDKITFLKSHSEHTFIPREAFFEYKGQLYRGLISTIAYAHERRQEADLVYFFSDLKFRSQLDRDIAVMCELSDEFSQFRWVASDALSKPKKLQSEPVFTLCDGTRLTTHDIPATIKITDLTQLRNYLNISDEIFQFGLDYISFVGNRG